METEKNNKGVIALFVVIVVILLALVVLLATGTISFKSNQVDNENDQTNGNETVNNLTEAEATIIVKNLFTNDTVQYLIDNVSVTYCKRESTNTSEKELGLNYEWNGYNKCTDFKSYEELTNYFKQYITNDYFNQLLLEQPYLNQERKMADGTTHYNYYEKDGSLYAANTGKGSNVNKYKLLTDEIVYKLDSFDANKIITTITAKWEDVNGSKYSELEKMTIVNDNGNWKISSYESTQI